MEELEFLEQDRFYGATPYMYADGTIDIQPPTWVRPDNFKFTLHRVVAGQTLSGIAYLRYNAVIQNPSQYWWLIAVANDIELPWDLTEWEGRELVIPDMYQFQVNRG